MIGAYDKCYLEKARTQLGVMLDYSANLLGLNPEQVYNGFVNGPASALFEQGDPWLIAGKSGVELCYYVLGEMRLNIESYHIQPEPAAHRSREYWAGWALAYYQWYAGCSFMEILSAISFDQILQMYPLYHEMDIAQFVDQMDAQMKQASTQTKLRKRRDTCGISQSDLARDADVPLRQIQLFEQGQRDINKTSAVTLFKLSKALHCKMEDLLERSSL